MKYFLLIIFFLSIYTQLSWLKKNRPFAGKITNKLRPFIGTLLTCKLPTEKISKLQFHLEARPFNSDTQEVNQLTTLSVLLIHYKLGKPIPSLDLIYPNNPGLLPWNSYAALPESYDFDRIDTKVYKFEEDVIMSWQFSTQNTNMTSISRYISQYISFHDPWFKNITLQRNEKVLFVVSFGSQDRNSDGFLFNGYFNWE